MKGTVVDDNKNQWGETALYPVKEVKQLYEVKIEYLKLLKEYEALQQAYSELEQEMSSLKQNVFTDC